MTTAPGLPLVDTFDTTPPESYLTLTDWSVVLPLKSRRQTSSALALEYVNDSETSSASSCATDHPKAATHH